MKLKPLREQVVVLVGASSGIGREAALRLARRGARIVVSARDQQALDELVAEICGAGGEAVAVTADATRPEELRALADRAVAEYGRIDTWVQLAGVGLWAKLEETTPEEWAQTIDVNLNGQAYGAMAAIPHLRQAGGGALILVSSVEAQLALPLQTAYSAAKHGIHALARGLRVELMHDRANISVTEIMPAGTDTPIFDEARTKTGAKPMPIPPIYTPSVAADAIVYAAEHPIREMVLGGVSKAGMVAQFVLPGFMDWFLLLFGFRLQKTDQPKSEDAPTNVFQPQPRVHEVAGTLGHARSFSTYAWIERHPVTKGVLAGALLGSALMLGGRVLRRRHGDSG